MAGLGEVITPGIPRHIVITDNGRIKFSSHPKRMIISLKKF